MNYGLISSLLNTVLVLFVLFYQIYKNKSLVERIENQKSIIEETKALLSNQSNAIESQGKVVDTAIKYSESFSPDKLGQIIRRELEIEKKQDIEKIKNEFTAIIQGKDSELKKVETLYEKSKLAEKDLTNTMVAPLLTSLLMILFYMPEEERNKHIEQMKEGKAKVLVVEVLNDVNKVINSLPVATKEKLLMNPSLKFGEAMEHK